MAAVQCAIQGAVAPDLALTYAQLWLYINMPSTAVAVVALKHCNVFCQSRLAVCVFYSIVDHA
jgi:hypothetical protein